MSSEKQKGTGSAMTTITLGRRQINRAELERPYLIAEAGVNHEGDMDKARLMIRQAARAGADAIKFQSYKAETLASKFSPAYWDTTEEPTESQYELFKKHDSFWEDEFRSLARYADEQGIDFLSTPFDFEAVDFLEEIVPAYKIASADITNYPLLEYVASKGKPILLSTGASTISEIYEALEAIEQVGSRDVVLLHCVLNYPTSLENANLGMIWHMRRVFPDHIIGYSDHTLADHIREVLPTAWLLGAQVIEKHFTFDKSLPGNDHYHAMDEENLRGLVEWIDLQVQAIGERKKHYLPSEEIARRNARRSLVATRFIAEGETLQRDDIAIKRPGTGVPPSMLEHVIGARVLSDVEDDEVLTYQLLKLS